MIHQPLPPSAEDEVRSLLRERRKIEAIKAVRVHTGIGLKEAKDRVEVMERELGLPPAPIMTSVGLFPVFVVVILGLLGWWWLSR
jgi:Ribosomal protein L7/L12 C-terminal domain